MKELWMIIKNTERYPEIANELPNKIIIHDTKEKAIALAKELSSNQPGCDYAFYVAGVDY